MLFLTVTNSSCSAVVLDLLGWTVSAGSVDSEPDVELVEGLQAE